MGKKRKTEDMISTMLEGPWRSYSTRA